MMSMGDSLGLAINNLWRCVMVSEIEREVIVYPARCLLPVKEKDPRNTVAFTASTIHVAGR